LEYFFIMELDTSEEGFFKVSNLRDFNEFPKI